MRLAILSFFVSLSFSGIAQSDTTNAILGLEDYIQLVLANHPVVKQADLQIGMAEAELLSAKGQFDPKLQSSYDLKNFKEKEYYDLLDLTLKVPTVLPFDPKISFNRNEGQFVNMQNTIPDSDNNQQVSAGISLPLGKGLVMDERRLILQQAQIYQDYARSEQILMTNKILLTAIKDYWEWYLAYRTVLLMEQSRDIAEELFDRVKLDFQFGESAVVDTIQAQITYQTRLADYEKAKFEMINSRLKVSTHMWSETAEPLELRRQTVPDTLASFNSDMTPETLRDMIDWSNENHPKIQQTNLKIDQLLVENKWNKESLKPEIDLSYSLINAPVTPSGEIESPSFSDNYKVGVDFSFPLFLRKERGKIQKTNLKIEGQQYTLSQLRLQIRNDILSKSAETTMSNNLANQYLAMSQNYERLLNAEVVNLQTGESDLFKFNVQQDKYIIAQLKYLENLVKFQKNKAEILYVIGLTRLGL